MTPTTHQQSGGEYEPSEFADEFDVDPAYILAKGEEMAIARIRGITDLDLLQAFLKVEADRDARGDVIGAINQRKRELKTCPRGCDAPIHRRFETDEPCQVKHQNAVWHKTCIIPRDDGELVIVLHDEPEPADDAGDQGEEADSAGDSEEPEGKPADRPTGRTPKRIFDKLDSGQPMTMAGLKGWAGSELGTAPDETEMAVDALVNSGYIEETDDGFAAVEAN